MALINKIVTPDLDAAFDIVTLSEAKQQLRIEDSFTDEDTLIQSYIDAAVLSCQNYLNAYLQPHDMVLQFNALHNYAFNTCPVNSITVAYYKLGNAVLTTLPTTDWYTENTDPRKIKLVIDEHPGDVTTERHDAVIVTVSVGYTTAADVPAPIKQAIKLIVSDMYERREDRASIPVKVSNGLLRPYRNYL